MLSACELLTPRITLPALPLPHTPAVSLTPSFKCLIVTQTRNTYKSPWFMAQSAHQFPLPCPFLLSWVCRRHMFSLCPSLTSPSHPSPATPHSCTHVCTCTHSHPSDRPLPPFAHQNSYCLCPLLPSRPSSRSTSPTSLASMSSTSMSSVQSMRLLHYVQHNMK